LGIRAAACFSTAVSACVLMGRVLFVLDLKAIKFLQVGRRMLGLGPGVFRGGEAAA
jgi:hypothetical protein